MSSLKDIKLRIGSVKNTQQITKAMKMVAASKMKRAEDKIAQARPYAVKLRTMVSNLSAGIENDAHPLLEQREGGKTVVVVVTSDRGLCGGLNTSLLKRLKIYLENPENSFDEIEIIAVGRKGKEFFAKTDFPIGMSLTDLTETETADKLSDIMLKLIKEYQEGQYNRLFLVYNHFLNVISQDIMIEQVLPLEAPQADEEEEDQVEFLLEPSQSDILNTILPQYVENQAFTAYLDNNACEHASRMTAMDSATKNAGDMLSALQMQYNRARQAAITTELIEIISGAESL